MALTCSSARSDENSVGGADAEAGSGTAPYRVELTRTPYSAAPVTIKNVSRATSTFVPDALLRDERPGIHLSIVSPSPQCRYLKIAAGSSGFRGIAPCIRANRRRRREPRPARRAPSAAAPACTGATTCPAVKD